MDKYVFVSHSISFSDLIFTKPGSIDCQNEDIIGITFRNQGTRNVIVNGVIIKPDAERSYSIEDSDNLVYRLNYAFDETDPLGTNSVVITRAKRVSSVAYRIPIIDLCK